LGEIVLLHDGVGPDGLHQDLLVEHPAAVLHQIAQGVEDPRR
jgi:hypothetical protein